MIRLLVGLGNPTAQYEKTRHNAGFWFLDRVIADAGTGASFKSEARFQGLVSRLELASGPLTLLKPTTYMNRSGMSVGAVKTYYRLEVPEILVVHDDLDLAPGVVRIKRSGGHGGHNGLRDLQNHLGSSDFFRLRIGIGHPGRREWVAGYVLDAPSKAEMTLIQEGIDSALQSLPDLLSGHVDRAMNLVNARG